MIEYRSYVITDHYDDETKDLAWTINRRLVAHPLDQVVNFDFDSAQEAIEYIEAHMD